MFLVAATTVVRVGGQQAAAPPAAPVTPPVDHHARAWTRPIEAPKVAAVAVAPRFIAVAGPETPLAVFNAADGAPAWSSKLRTTLPPAFAGDDLVAICTDTALTVLRAATGDVAWQVHVRGAAATALLTTSSSLVLVTPDGVQAWKLDGSELWNRPLATANARAAVGPAAVYVPVPGPALATVDLATGAVTATIPAPGETGYIAVSGDRLLITSTKGDLSAYKLAPVIKRDWHWNAIEATGTPIADARSVYATLIDNTLYAYALGNGNQRWTRQLPARPRGGPLLYGGRVMAVLANGQLAQFRTDGTSIKDDTPAAESTRVVSVAADQSGALIAAIGVQPDESRVLIAWRPAPAAK